MPPPSSTDQAVVPWVSELTPHRPASKTITVVKITNGHTARMISTDIGASGMSLSCNIWDRRSTPRHNPSLHRSSHSPHTIRSLFPTSIKKYCPPARPKYTKVLPIPIWLSDISWRPHQNSPGIAILFSSL